MFDKTLAAATDVDTYTVSATAEAKDETVNLAGLDAHEVLAERVTRDGLAGRVARDGLAGRVARDGQDAQAANSREVDALIERDTRGND